MMRTLLSIALLSSAAGCAGQHAPASTGTSGGANADQILCATVDPSIGQDDPDTVVNTADGYTFSITRDRSSVGDTATLSGPEGRIDFYVDGASGDVTTATDLSDDDSQQLIADAQAAFDRQASICSTDGTVSGMSATLRDLPMVRCAAEGAAFQAADSRVTSAAFTTAAAVFVHKAGAAVGIAWWNARQDRDMAATVLGACCYTNDPGFVSNYCSQVYWLYWPLSVPGKP